MEHLVFEDLEPNEEHNSAEEDEQMKFDEANEMDLAAMVYNSTLSSPPKATKNESPEVNSKESDDDLEMDMAQFAGFRPESPPQLPARPEQSDVKRKSRHARKPSHFEFRQNENGDVEKIKIYDESGEQVSDGSDSDSELEPMPTVGSYTVYDDKNNVVVSVDENEQLIKNAAASGYTRVNVDDDTQSVTSLDDKTDFLFDSHKPTDDVDAEFQMNSTKEMLTEQQRIAYAGLVRLSIAEMSAIVHKFGSRAQPAIDDFLNWAQKVVLHVYTHLELNNDEQLMIESLAAHALDPADLASSLKPKRTDNPVKIEIVGTNEQGETTEINDDPFKDPESMERQDDGDQPKDEDDKEDSSSSEQKPKENFDSTVAWTVLCDLFLILLSEGSYDARSRTLLVNVAKSLNTPALDVNQFERKVTDALQLEETTEQDWTETEIIEQRRKKRMRRKYAYVGLATVGGGLVIGLSAGLLAPVVGAGLAGALGTIGITGTSSFLAGAGGTAIITTASTAIGARVGSKSMLKRAGDVKTFEFRPIYNNNRVNVVITISGWMTGKDDDVRLPFSTIDPVMGDVLSVLWEPEIMRSLGQTINILATEALAMGVQQILAATIMTALIASLQAPMWLSKLSYLVDNPWSVSLDRAWAAGKILADTLINKNIGNRPAILVGYSLGARVIFSCLAELAKQKKYGLVQDVYLFGTPVFYSQKSFAQARSVVSGRYVNAYSNKDWILAFLFPAAKRYGSVLGLEGVPEPESTDLNVENVDVSDMVDGHMNYRPKMPKLLAKVGFAVLSEEFDEIEDPDPDKLREKQQRLLTELDEAETKPKKKYFWGFDFMSRAKKAAPEPKNSEDEAAPPVNADAEYEVEDGVFDVNAIKAEMSKFTPQMIFDAEEAEKAVSEKEKAEGAEPEHRETPDPTEFPEIDMPKAANPNQIPKPKPKGQGNNDQIQLIFE